MHYRLLCRGQWPLPPPNFPLPAKEVTAKHTQQVHPAAGATADLRAGEMGSAAMYMLGEKYLSLLKIIAGLYIENKSGPYHKELVASPAPSIWNPSFGDAHKMYKWLVIAIAVCRKEGSGFGQGGEYSHCPLAPATVTLHPSW